MLKRTMVAAAVGAALSLSAAQAQVSDNLMIGVLSDVLPPLLSVLSPRCCRGRTPA